MGWAGWLRWSAWSTESRDLVREWRGLEAGSWDVCCGQSRELPLRRRSPRASRASRASQGPGRRRCKVSRSRRQRVRVSEPADEQTSRPDDETGGTPLVVFAEPSPATLKMSSAGEALEGLNGRGVFRVFARTRRRVTVADTDMRSAPLWSGEHDHLRGYERLMSEGFGIGRWRWRSRRREREGGGTS
ncbi:hypothetical protein K402DRAFT_60434 [Aulographum hederae CBS 113979]|uniref:Uncharacterized protein n=1 Tax=Aulographum hederae CBS 113979 TaxID=1176131 RepID=A0A6G1H192_9PEZI|nr:hypothetical protein K402DRAFT_60434 [Aulographum hederae CBS 113979]